MKILLILGISILCGILYRMGGSGNYPRQIRIIGVPFLTTLLVYFLGVGSWWLLLSFLLTMAAISTYWDFLFGDVDNFWFHGFVLGIAAFPIIFVTGHWWIWGIRCILLALIEGAWSAYFSDPVKEEFGRGFFIPATIWMVV